MKQRPSFQFYQQDFLGSLDVKTMTTEQVGCYCLLLFNCYNNGGRIPDSPEELAILCHGTAIADKVLDKFYKNGKYLRNKRVDEELAKQERFSKIQSENAKKRWDKPKPKPKPRQSDGNAMVSDRECSSSSTSSSNKKKDIKKKFLEFVFLTEKEHSKLIDKLGKKKTGELVERLNNYVGSAGKKYASHYFTILTWVRDDEKSLAATEKHKDPFWF